MQEIKEFSVTIAEKRFIGKKAKRVEDYRLLTGNAKYLDDIKLPGMLHAVFVRSTYAHAEIIKVSIDAAKKISGVYDIITAKELTENKVSDRLPLAFPSGLLHSSAMPKILAEKEVLYVGEPIAIVLAENRFIAEDAAGLVEVEYFPLVPVSDARRGCEQNSSKASSNTTSNVMKKFTVNCGSEHQSAKFVKTTGSFSEQFTIHRGKANPIETRGIIVTTDPFSEKLSVWASSQLTHELRNTIAETLSLPVGNVDVKACDIGGGFGCKFMVYSEEVCVAAVAKFLGVTVKWAEDRYEHFLSAIQERDQYWDINVEYDKQGKILKLEGSMIHDQGAYAPHSITVPYNSASSVIGPYKIPHYELNVSVVRTNKPPVIPVRGAGYPQGTFIIERVMDRIALTLKLDRLHVRSVNLIKKLEMPFVTGLKNRAGVDVVYDSGDYQKCQDLAVEFFNKEILSTTEDYNIKSGVGFAHAVKCTGRGPFESATVRVSPNGNIDVFTGAVAIGQGTKTTLAQICGEILQVNYENINIVCGDTSKIEYGLGAFGSRQAMLAGSAVRAASMAVKEKIFGVAAQLLSKDYSISFANNKKEIFLEDGKVCVQGRKDLRIDLKEIALALRGSAGYSFPTDIEVGLEATHFFRTDKMAYSNAFHICAVEVCVKSGFVKLQKYIAVQDSGKIINPLVAEGQVHGGIVHGIGNALYEKMLYDDESQPLTTTFADYLLPTSTEVPKIDVIFNETPSPLNPLGAKGVGEASVPPVAPAIISAIENALDEYKIRIKEAPITPIRILELIEASKTKRL